MCEEEALASLLVDSHLAWVGQLSSPSTPLADAWPTFLLSRHHSGTASRALRLCDCARFVNLEKGSGRAGRPYLLLQEKREHLCHSMLEAQRRIGS